MMTLFFMEKNNLYQKYDLDNIINKIAIFSANTNINIVTNDIYLA